MTWTIENNSHENKEVAQYIEEVFLRTLNHISDRLKFEPPLGVKPITLFQSDDGPIVKWPLNLDKYEIGVAVDGIYPHQIILQMAHELCHIYIDPRVNGAFIEIVCHKTALDVLEEIGSEFVGGDQASVDEYVCNIRHRAEESQNIKVEELDAKSIIKRVQLVESTNILYDRNINNLVALKLKEIVDPIDKFGLIKFVRHSIFPPPPKDITDLTTNDKTIIDFDELIKNIKDENAELARILEGIIEKHC